VAKWLAGLPYRLDISTMVQPVLPIQANRLASGPFDRAIGGRLRAVPIHSPLRMIILQDGQLTPPFGPATAQNFSAALCLHPGAKTMNSLAAANFWLVCTFRHCGLSPKK
jgi:hypothetical protein